MYSFIYTSNESFRGLVLEQVKYSLIHFEALKVNTRIFMKYTKNQLVGDFPVEVDGGGDIYLSRDDKTNARKYLRNN